MKAWISTLMLSIVLSLSVCVARVSAENTSPQDKIIAEAAPFVKAALSEPMQVLQDKAESRALDSMTLGLAMYAGRLQTIGLSDEDVAMLKAMETRVVPLAQAYLTEHPQAKLTREKWKRILKVSTAEMAMVDRFQKRFMADYWLSMTLKRFKILVTAQSQRPVPPAFSEGVINPAALGIYSNREVATKTFVTACHCAAAVRKVVGLRYVRSGELPLSIRLLWEFAPVDNETYVEKEVAQGKVWGFGGLAVGASACGDDAQFKAYVDALKVSTAAPVN